MEALKNLGEQQKRALLLLKRLKKAYPQARCSLEYQSHFQLLIATLLSAQTTDVAVNKATPSLFQHYGTPQKMAQAPLEDLEFHLKSIGLYRTKAKNCQKTAQKLCEQFQGEVPQNLSALITLPGVGRKTANVVLANAFGVPAIVVDTHVRRIAYRLGLTEETQPEKIEKKLETLLPPQEWILCAHLLIEHGRHLCLARRPRCEQCPLLEYCPQKEPPRRPSSS